MGKRQAVIVDEIPVQVTQILQMCWYEPKLKRRACGNRGNRGPCFIAQDMGRFRKPPSVISTALCGNCFCTGRLLKGSPTMK